MTLLAAWAGCLVVRHGLLLPRCREDAHLCYIVSGLGRHTNFSDGLTACLLLFQDRAWDEARAAATPRAKTLLSR